MQIVKDCLTCFCFFLLGGHENNNIKIFNYNALFHQSFLLLVFVSFWGFVFPLFVFFWGGGSFFVFHREFFPIKMTFFCIFECLPFFLLSTPSFSSPVFHILLLCLFVLFLPSRLYLFFLVPGFVCFVFLVCLCLMNKHSVKIVSSFLFFWGGGCPVFLLFSNPFSLSLFFLI